MRTPSLARPLLLGALVGALAPALALNADPVRGLSELIDDGRYAEAESEARALLARTEEPGAAGAVLDALVESLWRGGKAHEPETLGLAQRALSLKESALGARHVGLAPTLDNLGHVYRVNNDYESARSFFARALELREAFLPSDHPDIAHSLNQLAWVLYQAGDFGPAKEMYRRSVRIRESVLGADHPDVASSLNNLAILLKNLGDYSGARPLYERALKIYESAYGADHPKVASSLNNLAILLELQGDYGTARYHYERAIEIRRKTLGSEHPLVAQGMNNLAALLATIGDHPAALKLHEAALKILESRGPEHQDVLATLNNLGDLLIDMGDVARARPLLERALAAREKTLGPDHLRVAAVLVNLGRLHVRTGDMTEARRAFERALDIREHVLDGDHPDVAALLEKLADVSRATGDYAGSKRRFETALAAYEKSLGPTHPRTAACLRSFARLLYDTGDRDRAVDLALSADEIGREHLRLTARTLPEEQALAYATVRPAGQHLAFSILAADRSPDPATTRRVWNALIRSRALVLDEMRARHRAMSRAEVPARELARTSEQLANLLVAGPGGESLERYRRLLESAREEKGAAERALAEASLAFRRQEAATDVGFDGVVAALPPGSALVAYARYEPPAKTADPSYLALVLGSAGADPVALPLAPADEIEPLVTEWRKEIAAARDRIPAAGLSGDARHDRVSERLRQAIWDPIIRYLGQAEHVFVVPDGALQLVNLDTLCTGDHRYLIESAPILHYLSAERDLGRAAEPDPGGRGLLVLGGPDFDHLAGKPTVDRQGSPAARSGEDCTDLDAIRFPALPGAKQEVELVSSVWSRSAGPDTTVSALLGEDATEDSFKLEAPGHRVVHLATHGFFVDDRCPGAADRGHADETLRRLAPDAGDRLPVVSGLALAGANARGSGGDAGSGDGMLTAGEIAAIDLSGVEWLVLSACETGLGRIRSGEGVLGLRRAFEIAGVRSLIMSLWSVEDAATRAWMRRLYEGRLAGLSSTEAVRQASLETLRQRRRAGQSTHPFYWGAFIAAGQ